jgi:hypothetical protein
MSCSRSPWRETDGNRSQRRVSGGPRERHKSAAYPDLGCQGRPGTMAPCATSNPRRACIQRPPPGMGGCTTGSTRRRRTSPSSPRGSRRSRRSGSTPRPRTGTRSRRASRSSSSASGTGASTSSTSSRRRWPPPASTRRRRLRQGCSASQFSDRSPGMAPSSKERSAVTSTAFASSALHAIRRSKSLFALPRVWSSARTAP